MVQISLNKALSFVGQSVCAFGVAGAATQYITKVAMQSYNWICPTKWKMEEKTIEKFSNTTAVVVSLGASIGLFAHKLFMEKHGRSDQMPAELIQAGKDKKFLEKAVRLLPHLMPY